MAEHQCPEGGVWLSTPQDARESLASTIGRSGCGPAAIHNVLSLLKVDQLPTPEQVMESCPARQRDYDAPLRQYLWSRAKAGMTHEDMIQGVRLHAPTARGVFFAVDKLTPENELLSWLQAWLEQGAIPVVTVNNFLTGHDAWHHQVVIGIDMQNRVWCTNPVMSFGIEELLAKVSSSSFMIIPRDHIVDKCQPLITAILDREESEEATQIQKDIYNLRQEAAMQCLAVAQQIDGIIQEQVLKQAGIDDEGKTKQSEEDDSQDIHLSPSYGHTQFDGIVMPFGGLAGITVFALEGTKAHEMLQKQVAKEVYLSIYKKKISVATMKALETL